MNFVDYFLADANAANIHDIIAEIAEIWNTVAHGLTVNYFAKHPRYVKDLVYILNFDAICAWSGLNSFVSDCSCEVFENTVEAFENIGYEPVVRILHEILELDEVRSFYNNRIFFIKQQTLRDIAILESLLQDANYNTSMWARLERYVVKAHLQIKKASGVSGRKAR